MPIVAIEPSGESSRIYLGGNPSVSELLHTHAALGPLTVHAGAMTREGAGWAFAMPLSNGNRVANFTFTTTLTFASFEQALRWDMLFSSQLQLQGIIVVMCRNEANTDWVTWRSYRPGVIAHEGTTPQGLARTVRYAVTVGAMHEASYTGSLHESADPRTYEGGGERCLEFAP